MSDTRGWKMAIAEEEARRAALTAQITALRAAHEALLRRTQSLETALDQEREKVERLRAFAQECEKESRLVNDFIDPVEMRHDMKRRGLLDENGNPTALLSGRGEGGNDG